MAHIEYLVDVNAFSAALRHFHAKTLDYIGSTAASGFTLIDASGVQVVIGGSGLTYAPGSFGSGGPSTGKITSLDIRDAEGTLIYSITDLKLNAADFSSGTFGGGLNGKHSFLSANDVVDGTAGSDFMFSGRGDDVLNGGNSHDILEGGRGNDTLFGGGGPDQFLYQKHETGTDQVMQFTDAGGNQDDQFIITHAMHDAMVVTAVAQGVELTFGAVHVIVHGWTVGQVGLDDFIFNG